jgi:C4-dicarboxylate transporter DctM subunit
LTRERLPYYLIEFIGSISNNPSVILLILGFIMLLLGMFFSVTTNLIMVVPLIMPLVAQLGVHPVHFGVIAVLGLTIGCVTPPVGAPMYIAAQFAGITIGQFARANIIYYIALIAAFVIVILVPEISLWLPSLVMR